MSQPVHLSPTFVSLIWHESNFENIRELIHFLPCCKASKDIDVFVTVSGADVDDSKSSGKNTYKAWWEGKFSCSALPIFSQWTATFVFTFYW